MRIATKPWIKTLIKLLILVILPVGLITAYGRSSKSESSVLRPKVYKDAIKIKAGDKIRTYYSLYPDAPITLEVRGPVRLRAITRIDFNTAISRSRTYEIRVYVDGSADHLSFEKKSKPSFLSTFADLNKKTPGKIRSIYVDIPKGKHTLVFSLETHKTDRVVRMRFLVTKENKQTALERKTKKWNFISPEEYKEKIILYVENNKRDYFRFSADAPLEIDTKGPAVLKILTRLEFSDMMKEDYDYTLAVYEDGNFKTEQFFQTKKASKIAYAKDAGLVAGVKGVFFLEVPEGKHNYRLELKKPTFVSVLCRPFIKPKSKMDQ